MSPGQGAHSIACIVILQVVPGTHRSIATTRIKHLQRHMEKKFMSGLSYQPNSTTTTTLQGPYTLSPRCARCDHMTGRKGDHTTKINGGRPASYLAHTTVLCILNTTDSLRWPSAPSIWTLHHLLSNCLACSRPHT